MNKKLFEQLTECVSKKGKIPWRLLCFFNNQCVYSFMSKDKTVSVLSITNNDYLFPDFMNTNSSDRWRLLEIFSKFEFILKQIIFAKLNPHIESINFYDYDFISSRNEVLDGISLDAGIHLLPKMLLKENSKLGKIYKLKNVRNELAHLVDIWYISYWKSNLKDNYDEFKRDGLTTYEWLVELYSEFWDQEQLANEIIKQSDYKAERKS